MAKRLKRVLGENLDYGQFFERGESFLLASEIIAQKDTRALMAAGFAFAANRAFATEVYLKVLAHLEHGLTHYDTHNLEVLFRDLSPQSQALLEQAWTDRDLQNPWQRYAHDGTDMGERLTFEEALHASAEAFVDFRYPERGDGRFVLHILATLLRNMILSMKREWKPQFGSVYSLLNPHPHFVKSEHKITMKLANFLVYRRQSTEPITIRLWFGPQSPLYSSLGGRFSGG
jgi:hypothetical protein